jgi:hypothetical protein
MATAAKSITRDDIEAKFRELRGEVDTATASARQYLLIGGAVAAVGLVTVAFFLGRRRGKRTTTVVEVKRL